MARDQGAVCILGIGGQLASGQLHEVRAPDYDDWTLNGDIVFWYSRLGMALEMSSMGIRVDAAALSRQLAASRCEERRKLNFHRMLMAGELPCTVGGGIGQSRLCMFMLHKQHIGEVQASVWPPAMESSCEREGIPLL